MTYLDNAAIIEALHLPEDYVGGFFQIRFQQFKYVGRNQKDRGGAVYGSKNDKEMIIWDLTLIFIPVTM